MAWSFQAAGDSPDEAGLWANLRRVIADDRAGTQHAQFAGQTLAGQYPPTMDEQLAEARAQLADALAQNEAAAERIASLQGELTVAQEINHLAAANQEAPA